MLCRRAAVRLRPCFVVGKAIAGESNDGSKRSSIDSLLRRKVSHERAQSGFSAYVATVPDLFTQPAQLIWHLDSEPIEDYKCLIPQEPCAGLFTRPIAARRSYGHSSFRKPDMAKVTPPRGYSLEATEFRQQWLAERTGLQLPPFEPDPPEEFRGLVENQVGYVAMPMSVAGPLRVHGDHAEGDYYVPLCTLEGTLTLSMTRGCYLTYMSGGITTRHIKQEISRSPAFTFEDIDQGLKFAAWLDENFFEIKAVAESTTNHGRLLRLEKHHIHNRVIVEFIYSTADAAGQNMVTIATDRACRFIVQESGDARPTRYLLESNFSCDKNPAHKAILQGRGHSVIASCLVPNRLMNKVLRASAEEVFAGVTDKQLGTQLAGVVGFNLHTANALAGIYLATGQDVACVAENSVGTVTYELKNSDLLVSLTMPSITVGTVGGATRLRQQRHNLQSLGCTGRGSAKKLAEIISAAALSLELSLAGAIVTNEFAACHAAFGRQGVPAASNGGIAAGKTPAAVS